MIQFTVADETSPVALIRAIRHQGVSTTMRRRIKHQGICTVNGQPLPWTGLVQNGDKVCVELPEKNTFEPEAIPLHICYEDDYLLLIDKQAGLLMHPTSGMYHGTLANGVAWYYEQTGQHYAFHPMHRLDKNTSGLVMIAKQPQIQYAFAKKKLFYSRTYLALTAGRFVLPKTSVRYPIGRRPDSIILRMVTTAGKPARTDMVRLAAGPQYSLLEIALHSGRTHQIRVHCSFLGFPLLGDDLYGGPRNLIQRQALHACCIRFKHPVTDELITVKSPVPEDMDQLIHQAGWDDILTNSLGGMSNAISND